MFAGVTANGAVQLYKDVASALPNAHLYGADGDCESGFTNPTKKGIPASVGKNFQCTVATLDLNAYPGGKKFLAAYKAKYNDSAPDPYAIYGYEAMQLGLQTIAKLGAKGSDKSAVLDALFKTKNRSSVLGTYSFDQNGDTSLKDYGVYKVGANGDPVFEKAIKAQG
jgi:branched-chain amino acid transport system substrate-binding protein